MVCVVPTRKLLIRGPVLVPSDACDTTPMYGRPVSFTRKKPLLDLLDLLDLESRMACSHGNTKKSLPLLEVTFHHGERR